MWNAPCSVAQKIAAESSVSLERNRMNLDNAFSSLRSYLNKPSLEREEQDKFFRLVEKASHRHPLEFEEKWLPYMEGYGQNLSKIYKEFGDIQEIVYWSNLVPHMRFYLRSPFSNKPSHNLDDKALLELANNPDLEKVESIELGAIGSPPQYISAQAVIGLLHSEHVKGLKRAVFRNLDGSLTDLLDLKDAKHLNCLEEFRLGFRLKAYFGHMASPSLDDILPWHAIMEPEPLIADFISPAQVLELSQQSDDMVSSFEALIDEPELGEAVKDYFRRWVSKLQSIKQALELPMPELETP